MKTTVNIMLLDRLIAHRSEAHEQKYSVHGVCVGLTGRVCLCVCMTMYNTYAIPSTHIPNIKPYELRLYGVKHPKLCANNFLCDVSLHEVY